MVNLANLPTSSHSRMPPPLAIGENTVTQYFTAVVETSQALHRGLDFYDLLEIILTKMMDIGRMSCGSIVFVNENGDFQHIGGYDSAKNRLEEGDLVMPPSLITRLTDTMDVVVAPDVISHPTFAKDAHFVQQNLRAAVALPLVRGKRLLGGVFLANRSVVPPFEAVLIAALSAMAAQLSLALDHALTITEMAALNESLEGQIQTRTEQLSEANRWLAETLRQTEQKVSQQADSEKRRTRTFSALVHELRSPMQLLIGHAWVALAESGPSISATQRESLDTIVKSSEYIQELVSKILDVNKLEEGALALDPVPLDLRTLIIETLDMGRGLLQNKPVQMLYTLPEKLPTVLADPVRVRQVLMNLLANACRFTDQGKITVSAAEHKGYVIVGVADTGSGIPDDKVATIFDPYVQAETTHSHVGTGLGLTISKQLVELHGGQMWVKSTLKVGSVFFFSLPIMTL